MKISLSRTTVVQETCNDCAFHAKLRKKEAPNNPLGCPKCALVRKHILDERLKLSVGERGEI